jgi:hypothetical protein
MSNGRPADRPFVLLVQPTLGDRGRAPEGRHCVDCIYAPPPHRPESAFTECAATLPRRVRSAMCCDRELGYTISPLRTA